MNKKRNFNPEIEIKGRDKKSKYWKSKVDNKSNEFKLSGIIIGQDSKDINIKSKIRNDKIGNNSNWNEY